ncbi:MAG TPA: alpha/beta fold hydrolase [Casimicrobiaceae bacterium]|nr:alpha/beta fold hydrolase [Casimicrobiaceae bacterium]
MNGATIALSLAAIPLVYFAVMLVLTAMYFALAWFCRARRPPERRIGVRATLRLVWREYLALVGAVPRLLLHRILVFDSPPAPVQAPVVLVHGVLCNAGVWTRFARFLRRQGIDGVYSLSYGPPLASIESFAAQLAAKIDDIIAATNARSVAIVAHSMGGLVTRAYLRRHGHARIARVLTIGSPHHGSMFAWFFPGVSLAQMRPGNDWLAELNRLRLDPALRFVSLWSWHDSMVAPQTSSELPGAVDVVLRGVGHNALLGDDSVFAFALGEIVAAREEAQRAPTRASGARAQPALAGQGQAG